MICASLRRPWWVPVGLIVVMLGYLPTLSAPFDFTDDGNLVYPAPSGTTLREHADLWWEEVVANVEHLGPFRPTLWIHWHLQANLFDADPLVWRTYRLLWGGLAATMLLWLLRTLRIHPAAALFATAAAMWNPFRSEIWTSLTLSEGVAMPYALFALIAARKATVSKHSWMWDAAGFLSVLVALGCKNTFAALVPAQMALRMLPDEQPLREAWRQYRLRAAALATTLALPLGHFVYFKLNWHPGQYQPHGPSLAQIMRILSALKGGMALDLLGAGIVLAVIVAARRTAILREYRAAIVGGSVLAVAGAAVYLPMDAMSGRYTMPAVWGLDILLAVLLTAMLRAPGSRLRTAAILALLTGLGVMFAVSLHRQEKLKARERMLWEVVHYLETHAPANAGVEWVSGNPAQGALGVEEGIHVQWHLARRGRPDIRFLLLDSANQPVERVELPTLEGAVLFRVAGSRSANASGWEQDRAFTAVYQFGRKRYDCQVSRRAVGLASASPSP